MKFKAVIFDLDGTLLDTIDDIADAVNFVLKGRGFPEHDVETYKMMVGAGVENLVERSLPEGNRDEQTIQECIKSIGERYRTRGLIKTKPYDGIFELLDELTARGLKLAVLSNKPHESASRQIGHYLSKWNFEAVEGAKPDMPNKPDPSIAIHIAERLNVDPHECIFLGDSEIDIQTANAAGMYAVGASWGFRPAEELAEHGAKMLISKPAELLELFG